MTFLDATVATSLQQSKNTAAKDNSMTFSFVKNCIFLLSLVFAIKGFAQSNDFAGRIEQALFKDEKIKRLVELGKFSISVYDLNRSEENFYHLAADKPQPGASLVKLLPLLKVGDHVCNPNSGINLLTPKREEFEELVKPLAYVMIRDSHNTAATRLIQYGYPTIQEGLGALHQMAKSKGVFSDSQSGLIAQKGFGCLPQRCNDYAAPRLYPHLGSHSVTTRALAEYMRRFAIGDDSFLCPEGRKFIEPILCAGPGDNRMLGTGLFKSLRSIRSDAKICRKSGAYDTAVGDVAWVSTKNSNYVVAVVCQDGPTCDENIQSLIIRLDKVLTLL
jgi:Beta-lactamase enzyme family